MASKKIHLTEGRTSSNGDLPGDIRERGRQSAAGETEMRSKTLECVNPLLRGKRGEYDFLFRLFYFILY